MSYFTYSRHIEGKLSGNGFWCKSEYQKGEGVKHHSKQVMLANLGQVVKRISSKDGVFVHSEYGLVGCVIIDDDLSFYEVDIKDYPFLLKSNINVGTSLDFGTSYLLKQILIKEDLYNVVNKVFPRKEDFDSFMSLIFWKICSVGKRIKPEYFYSQDYVSCLFPNALLDSAHITTLLTKLGSKEFYERFFSQYIPFVTKDIVDNIVAAIDSTALPNDIDNPLSYPTCHGSGSVNQIRMVVVLDQVTNRPIWFKLVTGNLLDNQTIYEVIEECNAFNLSLKNITLDAGYITKENIKLFKEKSINYIVRLKANDGAYKDAIRRHKDKFRNKAYSFVENGRVFWGYKEQVKYNVGTIKEPVYVDSFLYTYIDNASASKHFEEFLASEQTKDDSKKERMNVYNEHSYCGGLFMIMSSRDLTLSECLNEYFKRGKIESFFKRAKRNDLLPIAKQNEVTIRGHVLYNFLCGCILLRINDSLVGDALSVDDVLVIPNALKCTKTKEGISVGSANLQTKDIFKKFNVAIPRVLKKV